jgi:methylglyoxal synthase/DNA-binding transcriptional regulator LsrR (DeoR family)
LVGGAVVGLDGVFKEHAEEVAAGLDLDWTIDCVVYLIDPLDATSMQPETLALKRECAVTHTPFLDTYTSAVEFFGLLGASASTHSYAGALPDDLREPFGYTGFPHDVLAMIAHDSNKEALLEFARENIAFLSRFAQRIGTATTAALLNGHVPDRIEDAAIKHASELLRVALESAGVDLPWVDAVASGREGGNMQIAEAVAMGMCDSVIVFEEPRPLAEYGITHQLIERNARRSNHPDQLGARGKQMLLHDPRSTAVWAQLWEPLLKDGGPVSLETAYRDAFGVELVIAHAQASDDGRWNAITVEAAWYLLSAIGMARTSDEGLRGHTRVTVACGAAMCDMIDKIHPVATELSLSISEQHRRYQELVEACKSKFEKFAPRIEQLAQRRRLSLAPASDEAALWSMGSVTIAPIVGRLGGVDRVEATTVARRLAKELRCSALELDAMAFPQTSLVPNRELRRHWATTDIAVVTCDDLSPEWFSSGSPVALPQRMIDNLDAKGAIGEIAGIYIDVNGSEVFPDAYARHGMTLSQLRQIVQKGAGSASIMLAGTPPEHDDDKPPRRTATVCAALRAGAVSVLVSDAEFAIAVLREEARYQGEPTTGGSRESDLKHVAR